MKLRCGKCKKYKEEKFFSIHAREENRKNWIGKGSEQSNTTTIVVRGGYSYTCMDCNNTDARERYEREIKFPENAEKKRLFRKRSRHKKKYIKEGYFTYTQYWTIKSCTAAKCINNYSNKCNISIYRVAIF